MCVCVCNVPRVATVNFAYSCLLRRIETSAEIFIGNFSFEFVCVCARCDTHGVVQGIVQVHLRWLSANRTTCVTFLSVYRSSTSNQMNYMNLMQFNYAHGSPLPLHWWTASRCFHLLSAPPLPIAINPTIFKNPNGVCNETSAKIMEYLWNPKASLMIVSELIRFNLRVRVCAARHSYLVWTRFFFSRLIFRMVGWACGQSTKSLPPSQFI